jgi:oligopeptide/dipeptide ABC transporter ATP-binding protein
MSDTLLQLAHVSKHFRVRERGLGQRRTVQAVRNVSLEVEPGETVALVGESGSGKSTLGRVAIGLLTPPSGTVALDGRALSSLPRPELRRLRRRMQPVFQDVEGSMNPRLTVGATVREGLLVHGLARGQAADARVTRLLTEVGLDPSYARRYPHELSGGQRQRVSLARALAVEPAFLMLDEPVSALDVSVRAQVLALLLELREARGLTYLLIAHDLALVRAIADRVAVMYLGELVELGSERAVYDDPRHPYTAALLSAIPVPDPRARSSRIVLPGEPPSAVAPPPGCPFHPRCFHPERGARCAAERPTLRLVAAGHLAACHFADAPMPTPPEVS